MSEHQGLNRSRGKSGFRLGQFLVLAGLILFFVWGIAFVFPTMRPGSTGILSLQSGMAEVVTILPIGEDRRGGLLELSLAEEDEIAITNDPVGRVYEPQQVGHYLFDTADVEPIGVVVLFPDTGERRYMEFGVDSSVVLMPNQVLPEALTEVPPGIDAFAEAALASSPPEPFDPVSKGKRRMVVGLSLCVILLILGSIVGRLNPWGGRLTANDPAD